MSGPMTIAPSGRTTPCAPECRHPTCVELRTRAEEQARADALAKEIDHARIRAVAMTVLDGLVGEPTYQQRVEATRALEDLVKIAKGEG